MERKSEDWQATLAGLLLLGVATVLAVWAFAHDNNLDLELLWGALLATAVIGGMLWLILAITELPAAPVLASAVVLGWPAWAKLLREKAYRESMPAFASQWGIDIAHQNIAWWGSSWFLIGVWVALIAVAAWAWRRG